MTRTLSRFTRLLTFAGLILGAGCSGDDNKIPGDQKANPVSPTFLFLDVRASRTTATAGDLTHPVVITVQANLADTGAPVANGTKISLTASLGSFDSPGGSGALEFELFGGLGTLNYYPPTAGSGGTARIRAELQGVVDSTQISIRPAPGEPPVPEPAPVASTITLQADPTAVSELDASTDVLLTAIVRDNEGNPHRNGPVNFTTSVGSLASGGVVLASDSDGVVTDVLTVSGVELEALSDDSFQVSAVLGVVGGTTTATFDISILRADDPLVATTVSLSTTPTTVAEDDGDGGADESVTLNAVVRDQFGDFLNGTDVQFTTELGAISPAGGIVSSSGSGLASATLTLTEAEMAAFPADTFEVTATIGTSGGTVSSVATITIVRPAADPLTANFSFSADPSLSGDDVVEFTDLSTGGATSWSWDLDGDNVADDAFIPNPIFDYGSLGQPSGTVIQVTLIVGNGSTTSSISKFVTIQP